MPTLTQTTIPVNQEPAGPSMSPTTITLSCGGVNFVLTPDNDNAGISYSNDGKGGIIMTLSSFSGSLRVATKDSKISAVEEEPQSPETAPKTHDDVSPGQQKLTFAPSTTSGQSKTTKGRGAGGRKRSGSIDKTAAASKKKKASTPRTSNTRQSKLVTPKSIVKKVDDNVTNNDDVPMGQEEEDEPTQDPNAVDCSQTMDTDENGSMSDRASDGGQVLYASAPTVGKRKASVQEILDQVNSSNDSVATAKDGDDASIKSIDSFKDAPMKDADLTDDTKENDAMLHKKSETEGDDAAHDDKKQEEAVAPTQADVSEVAQSQDGNFCPPPRWGHSMAQTKDGAMWLYGGQSFDKNGGDALLLDDVCVYDPIKRNWSSPLHCKTQARQWHSCTYIPERNSMLVFGGETLNEKGKLTVTDSLKVLDLEICLWYPPADSGDKPTPRSGHTATFLPDTSEVVVFGGVKGSKYMNSLSILDTKGWVWSTPKKINGTPPKGRSFHTATAVKDAASDSYKIVLFGGNNATKCFNAVEVLSRCEGEWRWTHQACTGKPPLHRTGHSATLLSDGKTICIYGGWDPNEDNEEENVFRGSYMLDTETWHWKIGPYPAFGGSGTEQLIEDCGARRCGHSALLHPESGDVMAFGGRLPGEYLANDFQIINPKAPAETSPKK